MKVPIPTPLRQYTSKQASVEVAASTIGEMLSGLTGQFPDLRKQLFTEDGILRTFVNIYVNDEDIRHLDQEHTPVKDGDTISIVPSVAGGANTVAANPLPALSNDEILRYSRHLIMPEVGMAGQQKLKAARVLCIGAGGLGSPLALYLAAAGVGTLGLVDFDVVDITNLQRQIIHTVDDVGRPKLDSAAEKLAAINPLIDVQKFETRLTSQNALELIREFDVIADGTDNFPTRYLVNDACVLSGKPNVYASIFRFEGQASVFATEERTLLSLPVSRAAAAGAGTVVRRRRRPRYSPGTARHHSGDRGHQTDSWIGRTLDRAAVTGRCLGHAVP